MVYSVTKIAVSEHVCSHRTIPNWCRLGFCNITRSLHRLNTIDQFWWNLDKIWAFCYALNIIVPIVSVNLLFALEFETENGILCYYLEISWLWVVHLSNSYSAPLSLPFLCYSSLDAYMAKTPHLYIIFYLKLPWLSNRRMHQRVSFCCSFVYFEWLSRTVNGWGN